MTVTVDHSLAASLTPLALYVHWPFCQSKCPYCDFNSHVRAHIDETSWEKAFVAELQRLRVKTGPRLLKSVFFGGGTPSLMRPQLVERILTTAGTLWTYDPACEITLEANPTSAERQKFLDFKKAGVNRLSLGIQSFNEASLRQLGRRHNVEEACQAIGWAQETMERVSFDLIYARGVTDTSEHRPTSEQMLEEWRAELTYALSFGTEHLSLYQLTIEPGTAFATQHARGDLQIPEDDEAALLYQLTQELTAAHGMPAYETSNHARLNAESRHNLTYWRYEDYVGIGPGAHGRVTDEQGHKWATVQYKAPETWLTQVLEHRGGDQSWEPISKHTQCEEALMMGLRLREGVNLSAQPLPYETYIDNHALTQLQTQGVLVLSDQKRLQVVPPYGLLLNEILKRLLV